MGNRCQKTLAATMPEELAMTKRVFREERSEFEMTGKVDYNEDEFKFDLRTMLDDPMGQKMLAAHAAKLMNRENLFCWVDIHEYHSIPTLDYRRCMAFQIFAKYLKEGAPMRVGGLQNTMVEEIAEQIRKARQERHPLGKGLFDEIGEVCFNELLRSTYLPFRKSPEYRQYKVKYKRTYNLIRVEDFDYMGALGQGGFGRVVHARKKTTGQHLAMKIQLKTALLRHFRSDIAALESEKLVFASCHHPFIVNMEYSFQTDCHVFIVLDLVTGGDLHQARKACASRRLPEDRMMFYAAEIVLAVDHLHEMGIIYRDLKPQNVLLRADGHVQLTDMGLAAPLDMAWEWDEELDGRADESGVFETGDGTNSGGISPQTSFGGQRTPTGDKTPPMIEEHHSKEGEEEESPGDRGLVNDLEEKYQQQTKILQDAADAKLNAGSTQAERNTIINKVKDQEDVEAPLAPPTGMTPNTSEMRRKTKVRRSDTNEDSIASQNSSSSPKPSARSRGPSRKHSSNRIGSLRHNLTRGESLLHENLKATEEQPYIPERRKSVVGTRGYMAPEMVELRLKSYDNVKGYTEGVDWFALGVTMFELLTGRRPFDRKRGQPPPAPIHELDSLYNQLALIEGISDEDAKRLRKDIEEYETIMAPIIYPRYISEDALNMMERLMCRKLHERIGCRTEGVLELKNHPFFGNLNFDDLLNLSVKPPFLPENTTQIPDRSQFADFEDMMGHFEKDKSKPPRYNWHEVPNDEGKERFISWDWVSPLTLRREMGVQEDMELFEMMDQGGQSNVKAGNSRTSIRGSLKKKLSLKKDINKA
ncbi:hypothetical protein TrLO_g3125 [Triparma laevis f. longispina]|uniref:non-specific serine/threonine protein kinase n=1 Tax=Triparma laevis f. longispina TaxID=1714387 RepID=A0A9W7CBS0_9STRA|nr:hypothetical protein TrLO_g3125 [Triparma laevis f. longispina]